MQWKGIKTTKQKVRRLSSKLKMQWTNGNYQYSWKIFHSTGEEPHNQWRPRFYFSYLSFIYLLEWNCRNISLRNLHFLILNHYLLVALMLWKSNVRKCDLICTIFPCSVLEGHNWALKFLWVKCGEFRLHEEFHPNGKLFWFLKKALLLLFW